MAAGHGLGLRADGTLWAWGRNQFGQLGNGSTSGTNTANTTPTQEATLGTDWTTPGTGSNAYFSLVRTATAQSFASAGQNTSGQLGDGSLTSANRFDRVSPLPSPHPLPVELLAFTAAPQGPASVALAWATAWEVNSARFEVERSLDGHTFVRPGTVAAAGTSRTAHAYGYPDALALPRAGPLYYRLKPVDTDGSFAYSPVRPVAFSGALAHTLTLFPSPARGAAVLTGALALPAGLPAGVYVVRAGSQALRLTVE